jgi:hypothetical protein
MDQHVGATESWRSCDRSARVARGGRSRAGLQAQIPLAGDEIAMFAGLSTLTTAAGVWVPSIRVCTGCVLTKINCALRQRCGRRHGLVPRSRPGRSQRGASTQPSRGGLRRRSATSDRVSVNGIRILNTVGRAGSSVFACRRQQALRAPRQIRFGRWRGAQESVPRECGPAFDPHHGCWPLISPYQLVGERTTVPRSVAASGTSSIRGFLASRSNVSGKFEIWSC